MKYYQTMQAANDIAMAIDFSKICRICLKSNAQTYDIFTSYWTKCNILYCDMLSNCTKLKPHLEDSLPRLICKECCRQLKRTYTFTIQCEESEKHLKTIVHSHLKDECNDVKFDTNNSQEDDVFDTFSNDKSKEVNTINIKLEPSIEDNNDSCWDADDDSTLIDIKQKKDEVDEILEKPKKKRGRKKKELLEGETEVKSKSKLPHQCDICGKILSTKSNLNQHKLCHTDIRPYACAECPATFRGHSALFQHKKVHSGETPYHCDFCPKQFSRRTGLVNHIRMHKGEKLFRCEICLKTFVQSAQLSTHMKRHNGEKPHLCQICGKGFPIRAELKVHQRIHNGEKPYSCHLCTKTFTTSGNLSIHVRIHNKEIRYHCKECQRGFVTHSAYSIHVKRHKGLRDYHCECGKTFFTSSALKQHKVVHTGEKKYQCKVCGRKFTQTSHLRRHFKRDHMKPNHPMPASDQYRIVVSENKDVFNSIEVSVQLNGANGDVKCEGMT